MKGKRTSLGRRLPSFLRRERESNILNVGVHEMGKGLVWASQMIVEMYRCTSIIYRVISRDVTVKVSQIKERHEFQGKIG